MKSFIHWCKISPTKQGNSVYHFSSLWYDLTGHRTRTYRVPRENYATGRRTQSALREGALEWNTQCYQMASPPPTVALTVLAQLCGPKANETETGGTLLTKNGEERTSIFTLIPHYLRIYLEDYKFPLAKGGGTLFPRKRNRNNGWKSRKSRAKQDDQNPKGSIIKIQSNPKCLQNLCKTGRTIKMWCILIFVCN